MSAPGLPSTSLAVRDTSRPLRTADRAKGVMRVADSSVDLATVVDARQMIGVLIERALRLSWSPPPLPTQNSQRRDSTARARGIR
jgi:hypothetical protein